MSKMILIPNSKISNQLKMDEVYDRYAAALYGIILRIVQSESEAEFILEQTFLISFKEFDTYEKQSHFFIKMISLARSLARQRNIDLPTEKYTAEETLFFNDYNREATDKMCSRSRQVFQHVCIHNYTLAQTSLMLDMPLTEVRSLLRTSFRYLNDRISTTAPIVLFSFGASLVA